MVINFGAGSVTDVIHRILAPHIAKNLPGKPTLIIENKPGGRGTAGLSYLGKSVKPDGKTLGVLAAVVARWVTGAKFPTDPSQLAIVGARSNNQVVLVGSKTGVKVPRDLKSFKQTILSGTTSPKSVNSLRQQLFLETIGSSYKIIGGYRGQTKALKALQTTAFPHLPEQLDDDRRRIQARAMFEIGEVDPAIQLLAGDVSRNADLLRADIQWKSEHWGEAAKVLQRLAGAPPPEGTTFDRVEAQVILNWAVALRLDKDERGLDVVRELYGKAMSTSPLGKAFQFIASASGTDEPLDLETITGRIADNGVFEAFLAEYLADNKKRLLKTPVAPVQPPDATTPAAPPPPQAAAQDGRWKNA